MQEPSDVQPTSTGLHPTESGRSQPVNQGRPDHACNHDCPLNQSVSLLPERAARRSYTGDAPAVNQPEVGEGESFEVLVAELAHMVNSGLLLSPQELDRLVGRLTDTGDGGMEGSAAEAAEAEVEVEVEVEAKVEPSEADEVDTDKGTDIPIAELAHQVRCGVLLSPQELERLAMWGP